MLRNKLHLIYNTNMKKKNNIKTKLYEYSYEIPQKRGNGILNLRTIQNLDGSVVEYSMAYINHKICTQDNGRVIGYDNAHGIHHRHIFGKYEVVEFESYEQILARFEEEWKEYHGKQN